MDRMVIGRTNVSQRDDLLKFETGRIKALQEERLHIQKKTFTKWMNSFLCKARMEVEDLFTDLDDGKKLLKLLEIISGEKLAKPNSGRMRVHKIENVNKSLAFLHTKVRLESIGAEDIVDGNPRLILGLIWTIILRFQIQEIEIEVDEENESSEKKSAKDALLLWCQRRTAGYPHVNIQDFTVSWRNGMGFNALIHAHRPDLIDYAQLHPQRHIDNLNYAFDVAQHELGIPRLLDAEDVDTSKPDEKSIMTYVASYYHTFARMKSEMKGGRRIANIVSQLMDIDKMKEQYEGFTTDILAWIRAKIAELEDRNFPNSLEGIQKELLQFKEYRTVEKPPKYKEKSEIEALFFAINMRLSSLSQPSYQPPDGQLIHDMERSWEELERAEHKREVALRDELLRQKRLEQLNYKFERKSVLREGYLKEMIQVLSDPRYGSNLTQVEATVKKHEAISADILARKERFHDLSNMANELEKENYHSKDKVKKREREILEKWRQLLLLLEKHKVTLSAFSNLMSLLREVDAITNTIHELEDNFKSGDVGQHLSGVEDLLTKHNILESQVASMGDTIERMNKQAQQFVGGGFQESPILQKRLEKLNQAYDHLAKMSHARRILLEEARNYFLFVQNHEEEEAWVVERQRICQAGLIAKDLRAVVSLQQKHKALEDEIRARTPHMQKVIDEGESLLEQRHPQKDDIKARIESLRDRLNTLKDFTDRRKKQLEEAIEAYQFYGDANEVDSWLKEKMPLVESKDYGEDEPGAQSLMARHKALQEEIKAYAGDLQALSAQGEKLIKSGISQLDLSPSTGQGTLENGPVEEWVTETRLVPQEVLEEEPVEKTEYRTVIEERRLPQVKALYPFSGQGISMAKGEVLFLVNRANEDWWNVRKTDGRDGFVPANYVKETEPKVVQVKVRKPEVVREMKAVKKTKMVKQNVRVKKVTPPKPPARGIKPHQPNESVEKRLKILNASYNQICKLAQDRHTLLEDAMLLFGFYHECDDFEKWMKDQEKTLQSDKDSQDVDSKKRKFEKFVTDLVAATRRLEDLDKEVDEFAKRGHSQLDKIKARHRQIHALWDRLNRLRQQTEKNLAGASSVELFNRTCDEARDWMEEKMNKMDMEDLGKDLKTVQALQRKHEGLERELAPLEEKVNRVNLLANSVMSSYPNEKANIAARQKELHNLWQKVKGKAADRRNRLEEAVGQAIFLNSAKSLLNWVGTVKEALNADDPVRDVATAEELLKKHGELGDDIRAHDDEFQEVKDLGQKLLKRNPQTRDAIYDHLIQLQEEERAIKRGWQEKDDWLRQCRDLQIFEREAEHIDSTTSAHETFLEYEDLGDTVDEVEALLKRHEDFENKLIVQDDRANAFSEMADRLIDAKHYEAKDIDKQRKQILARREAVKEKAAERRGLLHSSQAYQQFQADADDMFTWMTEKRKMASDESYRDLSNLERKLQKHEAFERELRANEGRLRNLNKAGQSFITHGHYRKNDIQDTLDTLNKGWGELTGLTKDKGKKLRQASAQHGYNRTLEDAKKKVEEFEFSLQSTDYGSDLRSVKHQLHNHQMLENDMAQWEAKINDLVTLGDEMAKEGHFDSANILQAGKAFKEKFGRLKDPAARRRNALEESLRFYEFCFEVDHQMQWIKEHLPAACSDTIGQSLTEAQSLHKKHKKLSEELAGHEGSIQKTLSQGQALVDQKHPNSRPVEEQCKDLKDAWQDLLEKAKERGYRLDLSLKAQQFFADANEIESWLTEKQDVLLSKDYGRNEEAAKKLLAKHKALELELDSYIGLVTEMGSIAQGMVKSNHPESKMIQNRQGMIAQQVKNLQKMANTRRQKLMESMYRHEYFRESDELEQWINEMMQTASSEDYGKDYEHLVDLQTKFQDFKLQVEAGSKRYEQFEDLAKKLIGSGSPYSAEIEKRKEHLSEEDGEKEDVAERSEKLREKWGELLEQIQARDEKLEAAGDIHRFNRDVSEALSRMQEKELAMNDDLGRDLNSVQSLIKKHEGFENDLVALEAQLQVLVDDAARLQVEYPGENADHIKEQQEMVVQEWTKLQERASQRKEMLQASLQLQKFLSSVRDLVTWASDLRSTMMTEEKVRDAASAQTLKAEHESLKAEIEAREDNFSSVVEAGETMISDGHYAAQEVKKKLDSVLEERQKLHAAWHHKKVYLDQLIDLHFFLRDAKQLTTAAATQEAALASSDYGSTVEEVDAHVKKQEAFDKLIAAQDEKLVALQEHGAKLVHQNHFDSPAIQKKLEEVVRKRKHVSDLAARRKQHLADELLYAQFCRDKSEAMAWIDEKCKRLESESQTAESVTSLEEKIKKLQKHQAFEAELAAHEPMIKGIHVKGDQLLRKKHSSSREIQHQLDELKQAWNRLLAESQSRSRGLEEAQDILEFNSQVEKVEQWIRDKETMVHAGDMGRDYEHCLSLQRKLDDMDSDMRVDDSRMRSINALADKLIRQGRSDTRAIQQRREELNLKWKALQGALSEYREHLAGALEIHAFNRDVSDTHDRISEKSKALSVDDAGKTLAQVEALQRKQDKIERDMTVIEGKIKDLENEAKRLMQKYPDMSVPIRQKLSELQETWRALTQKCQACKQQLAAAYTLQKFKAELKDLEKWVENTQDKMSSGGVPVSQVEAESMLELHQERKAEIDGRQETFKALKDFGHHLIQQNHWAKDEVEEAVGHLEEMRRSLSASWEEQKHFLLQALQSKAFFHHADEADEWLADKEAFLNNDDLGDSMAAVETLIRKHRAFEKTLHQPNGTKVDQLEKFAMELVAGKHYDSQAIQQRLGAVCRRRDRLKENSMIRSRKLAESQQLQQFLRNIYEVVNWIAEKMQVACDESYRDPMNLQSKIQKHQAFEAEILANKGRVNAVNQEGEQLIGNGHFAAMDIRQRLDELEQLWRGLLDASREKKERLQDAYKALAFNQTLDDLDAWMDEIEGHLQSEDHGHDMTSVQNLLKKHQQLESDIHAHADNVEQVKDTSVAFRNNQHFMKDEIDERVRAVIKRYESLHEPLQIRRDNLEDAQLLYQFFRDVEDELVWISEKEPVAQSEDLGASLSAVQTLTKKHQALEAEIQSHEPMVNLVSTKGQQMMKSGHFASSQIDTKVRNLAARMAQLKDATSVRRLRLQDALESQQFLTEASEADAWLKEKRQFLGTGDVGKDEDSVQVHQKKLENLVRDLDGFNTTIGKLAKLAQKLVDRGHFASSRIQEKQKTVEQEYKDLQMLAEERQMQLSDSRKFFRFVREVDEVAEWINDQMAVAASEDYGRDVEHIEVLIQKFESFMNVLSTSEDRLLCIKNNGLTLVSENHPRRDRIKAKIGELEQLWDDLKELATARQEALIGAKQVHVFDRTADETVAWIQEKETVLTSEDYGHDLESIQTLVRKHQGFERDLAAVKEQVEAVVKEAQRLASLFPDAREHVGVKHEETVEAWNELLEKSALRKDKLQQAEQLQAYFDEYRELMAWTSEMIAKVTAPELGKDVKAAEAIISRHNEYKAEIDARIDAFAKFASKGQKIISQGHFMSDEIQEKISVLEQRKTTLLDTWELRNGIYIRHLDTQKFLTECAQLENWLSSRQAILEDNTMGESIPQVEDLIRTHEDFEKTVEAQAERFNALSRLTALEEEFQKQKKTEEEARKAEAERKEQDRIRALKNKEVERITTERRREDERRRTQEIRLTKDELDRMKVNGELLPGQELTPEGSPRGSGREPSPLKKMGSQTSLLGLSNVKRAESMRVGLEQTKKTKRTPSFTTRRRTQSFRKQQLKNKLENMQNLPPVEVEGFLDRKQELQSGGKRATIRSWKTYYTVLCGQLLCFFKDQDDFLESKAASSPLSIYNAKCEKAEDYTKKKNVFRLQNSDGAEYLFTAENADKLDEWVKKVSFHATLPPRMQLLSYDSQKSAKEGKRTSSTSSASSSEDSKRRTSLQDEELGGGGDERPPIPPKGQRPSISSDEGHSPSQSVTSQEEKVSSRVRVPEYNGLGSPSKHVRSSNRSSDEYTNSSHDRESPQDVPSVPSGAPPPLPQKPPPSRSRQMQIQPRPSEDWSDPSNHSYQGRVEPPVLRHPTGKQVTSRYHSLPANSNPPPPHGYASTLERVDSGSESEFQLPHRKDKRSSVLKGLFRKKSTHL